MTFQIGAHLSIAAGYEKAAKTAIGIGSNTFQFFTRNPRGGIAKAYNPSDVAALSSIMELEHFAPLLAHAPYTINMASDNAETRNGALELLKADLELLNQLPCRLYNVHPGSRQTATAEVGIGRVCNIINTVLREDHTSMLLLETMSGKGSELGATFEEIREMMDGIVLGDKIGVCMDTCHLFSAGYDIANDIDGVLTRFDKIIGLKRLHALHLNDSMNPFAAHKDRHAKIGEGSIGKESFIRIINHPSLKHLPMFLETPNEIDGYAEEISFLKKHYIE